MKIEFFEKIRGDSPVEDFIINKLEPKDQKKVVRALDRIEQEQDGLMNLFKAEYAKKLEKDLYELTPDKVRILFTLKDRICWLLHIFFKKTNKTPIKELNLARERKNLIFNK
ncbi:MAG: type II toxin-antitoxin system RelE/ParE family toxin [Bacilli bacterium]|nr:type II toxin-antitoxin system RelE/ParE family toxin [Bacilli bacterium]